MKQTTLQQSFKKTKTIDPNIKSSNKNMEKDQIDSQHQAQSKTRKATSKIANQNKQKQSKEKVPKASKDKSLKPKIGRPKSKPQKNQQKLVNFQVHLEVQNDKSKGQLKQKLDQRSQNRKDQGEKKQLKKGRNKKFKGQSKQPTQKIIDQNKIGRGRKKTIQKQKNKINENVSVSMEKDQKNQEMKQQPIIKIKKKMGRPRKQKIIWKEQQKQDKQQQQQQQKQNMLEQENLQKHEYQQLLKLNKPLEKIQSQQMQEQIKQIASQQKQKSSKKQDNKPAKRKGRPPKKIRKPRQKTLLIEKNQSNQIIPQQKKQQNDGKVTEKVVQSSKTTQFQNLSELIKKKRGRQKKSAVPKVKEQQFEQRSKQEQQDKQINNQNEQQENQKPKRGRKRKIILKQKNHVVNGQCVTGGKFPQYDKYYKKIFECNQDNEVGFALIFDRSNKEEYKKMVSWTMEVI